jgi:hypothetical protein
MGFLKKMLDGLMNILNTNNDNFKKDTQYYTDIKNNYITPKKNYNTVNISSNYDDNIIDFYTKKPKGYTKVCDFIKVAGVSYRINNVIDFINGSDRSIILEKELDNKYGKNAIKVIGVYQRDGKQLNTHIGYVPHENSVKIFGYNDLVAQIKRIFKPYKDKSPGLRIHIFAKEI